MLLGEANTGTAAWSHCSGQSLCLFRGCLFRSSPSAQPLPSNQPGHGFQTAGGSLSPEGSTLIQLLETVTWSRRPRWLNCPIAGWRQKTNASCCLSLVFFLLKTETKRKTKTQQDFNFLSSETTDISYKHSEKYFVLNVDKEWFLQYSRV